MLATRNPGKVREFTRLLEGLNVELLGLDETGVTEEIEETGSTFEENARIKAEGYSRLTGEMTLADDSGLEVDLLDGRPGVLSARYGGPGLTDEERVRKLLSELEDSRGWERTARFKAVVAVAGADVPGGAISDEGAVEGAIAHEPIGAGGFGYDPVFWLADFAKTVAELTGPEKDSVSHRGVALRKLLPRLEKMLE